MADIATLGVRIVADGVEKATKSLGDLAAAGTKVETGLTALKFAYTAASASVFGLFGAKLLKESIDAQNSMAQLEAAVQSTGGAAGRSVEQLDELSASMQRTSTVSDDAVKGAEAMLLTFTKIRGARFDEATQAVTDLAARMGGDLQGAAVQVGKALNDPVQGITALTRVGVSFTAAQKDVIKHLAETGHIAEAQGIILQELQTEFGGSAAAARDTLGGALTALGNDFGDLFERTKDETTAVVAFINALDAGIQSVATYSGEIKALAYAIGTVATAMGASAIVTAVATWFPIAAVIAGAATAAEAATLAFAGLAAVLGPILVVVAAVGVAYLAFKHIIEETTEAAEAAEEHSRDVNSVALARAHARAEKERSLAQSVADAREAAEAKAAEAAKKAAEESVKANAEAAKRIATMRAENEATRALAAAARQGQGAVDLLTVSLAGANAVRTAGTGLSAKHIAQLREAGEETARLTIAERKHAEALARTSDVMAAQITAYEKEKAAAKARADEIAETDAAVLQTVTEGVRAIAAIRKGEAEDTTAQMENLARDMQTHLSDAFTNIFTKGISSFRDLFSSIRDMFIRMVADMLAASAMKKLAGVVGGLLGNLAPSAAGAQGVAGAAGGISGSSAVAAGAGGLAVGYGVGLQSGGNRGAGTLFGAASGAATGAAIGSIVPGLGTAIGAVIGGLTGAIGGFFGAGRAAKEAAKNMEILQKSLAISMDALKADIAGDELGKGIAAINADREQRRQAYEEAYAGGKNERERYRLIAEMNALEDQRIAKLKEAAALQLRQVTEDVRIQIMRNNGQTEAADALAIQVDQERRLAALRKQGVDDATIAALRESETARAEADKKAVAAAEAIAAAAKAAQEAAEAAEKAFNQARAVEDLNVELLRAKGQGGAADDLAFQLEQQRRLEDAQKNQSADYIAKLKELQQIQRDQRAAQQLIDSTSGGGGGGSAGSTQAFAAVSAVVTDRTALMLVDLTRSSVSYLARIADNTGANGSGGGGVHIVNHFGADIDQDVADRIIDQLEQKLDARFGDRQNRQMLYTGSVAR